MHTHTSHSNSFNLFTNEYSYIYVNTQLLNVYASNAYVRACVWYTHIHLMKMTKK